MLSVSSLLDAQAQLFDRTDRLPFARIPFHGIRELTDRDTTTDIRQTNRGGDGRPAVPVCRDHQRVNLYALRQGEALGHVRDLARVAVVVDEEDFLGGP